MLAHLIYFVNSSTVFESSTKKSRENKGNRRSRSNVISAPVFVYLGAVVQAEAEKNVVEPRPG